MKKVLSMLMVYLLAGIILIGCSGKSSSETTNGITEGGASPTLTQPAAQALDVTQIADNSDDSVLQNTEIYVFIAASLNNAMTEISEKYKEIQPKVKVTFNADSSSTLEAQIKEGAECDLFFSAAEKQMKELKDEGLVDAASIKNLLENKVVLIKPSGEETAVTGFDDVFKAENLALAAESVPAGDYGRQIFKNIGIWDKIEAMEINEGSNVTAVLAAVSEGSNEVGLVYETDANSVKASVEIIAEAPEEYLDSPIVYPAGLVDNTEADSLQKEAAKNFMDYLSSEAAKTIFEKYGFTVIEN